MFSAIKAELRRHSKILIWSYFLWKTGAHPASSAGGAGFRRKMLLIDWPTEAGERPEYDAS